jgi:hypothetical protein
MSYFARITLSISGLLYLIAGLVLLFNDYRFRSIYSKYGIESWYTFPGIIYVLIGIIVIFLIIKK